MVQDFYHLREQPFAVAPDAAFFFPSETHQAALRALVYGVESGRGFVALIAGAGLGKTTLLCHALDTLQQTSTPVYLYQAIDSPRDLLCAMLSQLGVAEAPGSLVDLQAELRTILAERHRLAKPVLVVIDDAHHLQNGVLEFVRMLANFTTDREKLVQVVLCGQPPLTGKIASPEMEQLKQRISVFARLEPLSPGETASYIDHRLRTAGYPFARPLFTEEALALVARYSKGVPRAIHEICYHALGLGCALGQATIVGETIRAVAYDLHLERRPKRRSLLVMPSPAARGAASPAAAHRAPRLKGHAWRRGLAVVLLVGSLAAVIVAARWALDSYSYLLLARRSPRLHAAPASKAAGDLQMAHVRGAPGAVPPSSSSGSPPRDLAGMDLAHAVQSLSGRTLLGICRENFGSCDASRLDELHHLNPRLLEQNPLQAGKGMRMADSAIKASKEFAGDASRVPAIAAP